MDKSQLKLTDELAEKIKLAFASSEFQKSVEEMKKEMTADTGTFRMVISTDHEDRHGEVIDQNGWELENYMSNPVVLWGHNHFEIPVGVTDKLYIELSEDGTHRRLIAEGRFASHEFAQTLRKLYDEKMLRTSSVGFLPKEYNGNRIIKAELLEWSFVSIPANQFALSLNSITGLSHEQLVAKGLIEADKKEGDVVETTEEKPNEETTTAPEQETTTDDDKKDIEDEDEDEDKGDEGGPSDDDLEAIEDEADDAIINEGEKTLTVKTGKKSFVFKMTDSFVEGFKNMIELKAGRVISAKNLSKIKDAITALQEVVEIAEASDEEGKASDDVSPKGSEAEIKEAKEFLKNRDALQALSTALSDVLGEMKQARKNKA